MFNPQAQYRILQKDSDGAKIRVFLEEGTQSLVKYHEEAKVFGNWMVWRRKRAKYAGNLEGRSTNRYIDLVRPQREDLGSR